MRTSIFLATAILSGLFAGCAPGTENTDSHAQAERAAPRDSTGVAPAPGSDTSVGPAPVGDPSVACRANADCPRDQYCRTSSCEGDGACTARPAICLGGAAAPVCGCDGAIYLSDCHAALAGVNIASDSACATSTTCFGNADCGRGQYCARPDGTCGDTAVRGTCQAEADPATCGDAYRPMCGCDGITYATPCEASAAGVNIASAGPCADPGPPVPCRATTDCGREAYCHVTDGTCGEGRCEARPTACPLGLRDERVCGCDGATYESACYAAVAGVSVATDHACTTTTR